MYPFFLSLSVSIFVLFPLIVVYFGPPKSIRFTQGHLR
jgi:hypothetical protein